MKTIVRSLPVAIIIFASQILFSENLFAQCSGGTNTGSITPTAAWQTVCLQGGQYRTFSATAGVTYTFSFCQGGGLFSYDTQISMLDNSGVNLTGSGTYNDDKCGVGSELVFVAPATTTYRVLITKYNCLTDPTCQTLAYQSSTPVPVNDNICNGTYIYSNSCACTFKTYTQLSATNSPQAAPVCGTYNGADVWFKSKIPSSGQLNIIANAGSITNCAMAVYKGSSCSGALTSLGCDYDGAGNTPEFNLVGQTPGDSIFIRFWSHNNAQSGTFGLCIQDPAPYYCMSGNSSEMNPTSCLQVTPNKQAQQGCIWNTTQINMASSFDYTYTVNLGNNDAGADGLTFTLQNNAAGLSACGNPGWQLGIGPVTNSFAIEFDTYDNGAGAGDIALDHIAIDINGNIAAPVAGPVQANASGNIEDGLNHTVRITWDPVTKIFNTYFDGPLMLSYTYDIVANVFGGNPMVYWGFTGSTGLYTNTQSLCPGNLPGAPPSLPVTWGDVNAELVDGKSFVSWTTYTQINNKVFYVERSLDGLSFTSIGSVNGVGNTSVTMNYQFMDPSPFSGVSYYRIKQVDGDGALSYSPIKNINNSIKNSEVNFCRLYPNPATPGNTITADLKQDAEVEVYDNLGNIVLNESLEKGNNKLNLLGSDLQGGIYHFVFKSTDSVQFITLVIAGK